MRLFARSGAGKGGDVVATPTFSVSSTSQTPLVLDATVTVAPLSPQLERIVTLLVAIVAVQRRTEPGSR